LASRDANLDIYAGNKHLVPSTAATLALPFTYGMRFLPCSTLLGPEKLLGSMYLAVRGLGKQGEKSLEKILNMPLTRENQMNALHPGIHICKSTFNLMVLHRG